MSATGIRGGRATLLVLGLGVAFVVIEHVVKERSGARRLLEQRESKLGGIQWSSLPLQWAITTVRGTGRRKIAVLSDPNCPFCRSLEQNLAKLDDITIHVLPYAVLGPVSERQANAVWCSKDRAQAWNDLMFRRVEPLAAPDCGTPIVELMEFGQRIGARGTPTWFLQSGERFTGAASVKQLTLLLDEARAAGRAGRRS